MKQVSLLWLLSAVLLILPLSLTSQVNSGQSAFTVSRSSSESIQVHFNLPQWKLEPVKLGNETAHKVSIADAQYIFIDEAVTLPVFTTLIAIPNSGGVTLNTLGSEQHSRTSVLLDFDSELRQERLDGRYSATLYPENPVLMSSPQILRDFRVVSINIYPFQYDQQNKKLIVRESMDISISFDHNSSINELSTVTSYSSAFEKIYRGLILNFEDVESRDVTYTNPKLLVIYGNSSDTNYTTKVNEYVAWKRQKGFIVTAVSTATTGTATTAIQSYLQTQYNNTTTRPDYVVLIGDTSGSMPIPSNTVTYSYGTHSSADYPYTWLSGGDSLGDVIIGRISVETTEQFINYMAKIQSLEQNLDLGTASWLNKMVLVGDTDPTGISTIYTNHYVHDHSLQVNPSYTYTEIYGANPTSATINPPLITGTAFFNYRGWYGMDSWPNSISSLNNSYRLFHSVIITCDTGTFGGGTSATESVIRQGTSSTLGGGITSIGMATTATHTPMNNCLNVGIFHGIYPLGMRDMGSALLYGKLYLNAIYGVSNATQAGYFAGYCNLMGDPTAAVYVGIPSSFNATFPASIPSGTRHVEVTARNASNQVVEGASVTLTNASGQQAYGFTDSTGKVTLSISGSLSGSLTLTVSKDDFKPMVSSISITATGGAVYSSVSIDDDATGSSVGNANGVANSGETIELYVSLRNSTTASITPSASVTTSDTYITLIEYDRIEYSPIAAGSTGQNDNPVVFSIAADCPDNHQAILSMQVETTAGNWSVIVPVVIRNGKLSILSYTFVGATGNVIRPGDTFPMTISIQNTGLMDLTGITATLNSRDTFLSVTDTQGYYGSIAQGASASNAANTFTVNALSTSVEGMTIPMDILLTNAEGYSEMLPLTITIGQISANDPLGQDAYGYFIFDQGDTAYEQCPTYNWIGIAPAEGGSGTALTLTDPGVSGDEGDQIGAVSIQTVNLPFPFSFYGVSYSQISISSNGFIAFGATQDSDWRNWRMPDAGGPSPMVAVFWDDLDLGTGSGVYTYYNSTLHYYVVEWYSLISGFDSTTRETFQAILYDPVFFPTHTGDGQIKLQYNLFNNIDTGSGAGYPHGNFCSIGIEDHTETRGLEYTFGNVYPTAAATLSSGSALFITTRPLNPDYPYVTIETVPINDANANAHMEPGESASLPIRLGNRGLVDATGVTAVLSSSDPYVTITNNYSVYGNILAQGNAYPQTNYGITVSGSCPGGHEIIFTLTISSDDGNWAYNFPIDVYVPILEFSNMIINDTSGNNNRTLDPGETAEILILLSNTGEIAASAGSASLTCGATGITINTGSDTFPTLNAGENETLSFSVTAAPTMTVGTQVQFAFGATSDSYTYSNNETLIIGLIIETFENGNFSSFPWVQGTYPWTIDTTLPYAGIYAAKSGTIADNGSSTMELTRVVNTSGTLSFRYKVSSENNYDYLKFYIDGVQQNQWSGEVAWAQASYTLATGTRTLKWEYAKDSSVISGSDCAWIDDIIFPPSTNPSNYSAPQNPAASASNLSVLLTWSAPASGTPTGYKVFRNSTMLTSVAALTYTDLAVANGTTYSYYIKAVYTGGESDPTSSVTATPNAIAPTNLTAVGANSVVNLSWTGATGREDVTGIFSTPERTISSYRIYRNGSALTTTTGTTYQDTGLTNGVSYSYYVTTVYTNPAGESAASNTASATPNLISYVILGTGTTATATNALSPINNASKSVHGQTVYLASELNAAGVTGPVYITQLGFYTVSAPNTPLVSFIIRMMHTTATSNAAWITGTLTTVYSNASYMPTTGSYQMLTFSTPFLWNGTSNILVDTAFGMNATVSNSGTLLYTATTNGYMRNYSDTVNQTNIFSGGQARTWKANIRLALQPVAVGPLVTVSPTTQSFGNVVVNSTTNHQFTIQNTGDQTLTGTITTPTGYTVSLLSRESGNEMGTEPQVVSDRNVLSISVTAGQTRTYNLAFAPTDVTAYNGTIVIATNAANTPTVNVSTTGTGYVASLPSPDVQVSPITGGFQLAWSAVAWAQSYTIYASAEPNGTYSQIGTTTGLTYSDLRGLDKVFYYVKAVRD